MLDTTKAGVRFRNEIVTGVGGRQIIAEDPSGNPIEPFEPALPEARLGVRQRCMLVVVLAYFCCDLSPSIPSRISLGSRNQGRFQ